MGNRQKKKYSVLLKPINRKKLPTTVWLTKFPRKPNSCLGIIIVETNITTAPSMTPKKLLQQSLLIVW